jgi:hypothetical protein
MRAVPDKRLASWKLFASTVVVVTVAAAILAIWRFGDFNSSSGTPSTHAYPGVTCLELVPFCPPSPQPYAWTWEYSLENVSTSMTADGFPLLGVQAGRNYSILVHLSEPFSESPIELAFGQVFVLNLNGTGCPTGCGISVTPESRLVIPPVSTSLTADLSRTVATGNYEVDFCISPPNMTCGTWAGFGLAVRG